MKTSPSDGIVLVSAPRPGRRAASFWRPGDASPRNPGPAPVLALPGLGLDGRTFEEILALGSDRDLVLVNVDNDPEAPRHTLGDFASEALSVLDAAGHAGRPAVVLGSSFGGMVAQCLALDHPDRVAALVLVGTGAGWSSLPLRLRALARFHGLVPRRPFPRIFTRVMSPPLKYAGAELQTTLRRQMLHRTKGYVGDCLQAMHGFDPRPRLHTLDVPCVVVHGGRDRVFSVLRGRELSAAIPGARLVEVPDAGHLPHMTHPAVVMDAVRDLLQGVDA